MSDSFASRLVVLSILVLWGVHPGAVKAQSQLEAALGDLYATCLFEPVENNPFAGAAELARTTLAPGVSGFIESSLAALPLTPPNLDAEFVDGEVVNVVTGFSPIFTESSATVGRGHLFAGTNVSHFNLSNLRGEELSDLAFQFQQDGGGDVINVQMPADIRATVFAIYGTYGLTNRFDIGIAVPFVRLSVDNVNTSFTVEGDNSGCRYDTFTCTGEGTVRSVAPALFQFNDGASETNTFVGTVAVRAKYRFPLSASNSRLAAVVDMRFPTRSSSSFLGSSRFGTKVMLVGEYGGLATFRPYANLGAQFWNGDTSNSLQVATGFTQQVSSRFFFAFDLLSKVDLEPNRFLQSLDQPAETDGTTPLLNSSIPSAGRDPTVNAGVGGQFVITPRIHLYGSALFSLVDRGLQSTVAPIGGLSVHL